MKKVNVIIEKASDGGFSCYMQESFPDFALLGYGDTEEEAKEDLLQSYEELKQILSEEGKTMPQMQFVYHFAQW